jgi:hypothetical protein
VASEHVTDNELMELEANSKQSWCKVKKLTSKLESTWSILRLWYNMETQFETARKHHSWMSRKLLDQSTTDGWGTRVVAACETRSPDLYL